MAQATLYHVDCLSLIHTTPQVKNVLLFCITLYWLLRTISVPQNVNRSNSLEGRNVIGNYYCITNKKVW